MLGSDWSGRSIFFGAIVGSHWRPDEAGRGNDEAGTKLPDDAPAGNVQVDACLRLSAPRYGGSAAAAAGRASWRWRLLERMNVPQTL